jgi:hypothetical protein
MRKTARLLTILLLGMLGVCCGRLIPATRPPFTITGIVESVDSHGLTLATGRRVSIAPSHARRVQAFGGGHPW